MYKTLLSLSIFLLLFAGCKKDKVNDEKKPGKLKSVSILKQGQLSQKIDIIYNGNGSIARVNFSGGSSTPTYMTYSYSNGRPSAIQHYLDNESQAKFADMTVSYQNDILKTVEISGRATPAAYHTQFEFDLSGAKFTEIHTEQLYSLPQVIPYRLALDAKSNLSSFNAFPDAQYFIGPNVSAKYDNQPNPLQGLLIIRPVTYSSPTNNAPINRIRYEFNLRPFLSVNNCIQEDVTAENTAPYQVLHTLKYSNSSFLEEEVVTDGYFVGNNRTVVYTYE